jgi:hypothetical protein
MGLQTPKIISYDCADIEEIENWIPDDPEDVDF